MPNRSLPPLDLDRHDRQIVQGAIDCAVIGIDPQGRVVSWNEGARRILGWSEQEMAGQSLHRIFTPEDLAADMVEREMEQARHTGRAADERWHQRSGGERFRASGELMPLRSDAGAVTGFVKILRDRTQQQQQGEERLRLLTETLQASEQRLQLALDIGGMGVWQVNLPHREVVWWPGMAQIHGLPPGAPAPGTGEYERLIHPEDRERVVQGVRDTIVQRQGQHIEYRVVWPDGSVHWLEARGKLFVDARGEASAVAGVCMDITRRKRIESDPRKEQYARDMHRRFPPDPARIAGAGPLHVLKTGRPECIAEITEEVLNRAVQQPDYLEVLRALGVHSYIGVPLAVRGRTLGVITFITAESHRRYGAKDLALAEDLARRAAVAIENAALLRTVQESDRAKDVFLATLAHELRNPLAPVWNGLTIIARAPHDAQRVMQVAGMIERQVGQLVRLVDDLLDVSRITTGKIELKKEPADLGSVLRSAIETSRPHIEAARHGLSLVRPDEPVEVDGDPVRLAQVFANLLNNASKYTPPGGQIDVIVQAEADEAVVRVRDTGEGLAPVVDDNVDGAATLAELLRMMGCDVSVVNDGTSAVTAVNELRPDVVLPDINGYEVARQVRALPGLRQPRLIALTGWGQEQDKRMAARAGFDEHWTKPVDPSRLQQLAGG